MSVSHITTHVLDTTRGLPAEGVAVELSARAGADWRSIAARVTDADGRITSLGPDAVPSGEYRLRFDVGAYFAGRSIETFFPEVVLVFAVADGRHYHVPLLLSPFAYSTYRGS